MHRLIALMLILAPSLAIGAEKKFALLVGVNKYAHAELNKPAPLKFAEADVTDMKAVLEKSGYTVTLLVGPEATLKNIRQGITKLRKQSTGAAVVLAAFAGHGIQPTEGKDAYFCPYDSDQTIFDRNSTKEADWDLKNTMLPLSEVITNLKASGAESKAIIVDACRNDPNAGRGRGFGTEFNAGDLPENLALLLSCSKGERAFEDERWGGHGAFFHHVLKGMREGKGAIDGHVTANSLAAYVTRAVRTEVPAIIKGGATQRPHTIINGEIDFLIAPATAAPVSESLTNPRIVREKDAKLNKEFEYLVYDLGKGVDLRLVNISAQGKSFTIGSPWDEKGRGNDEDQSDITFTDNYYIGQFEITRGQFQRFVEETGYKTESEQKDGGYGWNEIELKFDVRDKKYSWKFTGFPQSDTHPVINVSWNDAKKFCEWLAKKGDGKIRIQEVRLPGEAEWEYACRAGSKTQFSFGNDDEKMADYGNVADVDFRTKTNLTDGINASDGHTFTAPIGKFLPNEFGLYDMHGNAYEWCEDYHGSKYADLPTKANQIQTLRQPVERRVLRGGSWNFPSRRCRSAYRGGIAPDYQCDHIGFRVVVIP